MIDRSSALGIRVRTLFEQAGRSDLLRQAYEETSSFDEAKALLEHSPTQNNQQSATTLLKDAFRNLNGHGAE